MTTPAPTATDPTRDEIAAFREFMGSATPWYSNAHVDDPTVGHEGRIACKEGREDSPDGRAAPMGPGDAGRPVPQWTRPGVTGPGT